jgi:hypothetical protein
MPLLGRRVGTGGALEGLYGALGNPTSVDRQRLYEQQQGALRGSIAHGQMDAQRAAQHAAVTAAAGGNPFGAQRVGAQAASEGAARVASQGLQQQAQLGAQQTAQEIQARQQQGSWAQQALGGLVGAGGQVLGMAVPAFGALGGGQAAGSLGNVIGGQPQAPASPLGPLGGVLGQKPQQPAPLPPQAPPPQLSFGASGAQMQGMQAPPGMRWDPTTNQWVPV